MKNLKNLGKALNKNEQKEIFGGTPGSPGGIDDGPGGGSPGSGGSSNNCGELILNCTPGKCFDLRWCRCVYGQGEGPGQNGACIN